MSLMSIWKPKALTSQWPETVSVLLRELQAGGEEGGKPSVQTERTSTIAA